MNSELFNKRHSLAHILIMAILKHYPKAKPTIGPVIDNGFYYDIDFTDTVEKKFSDSDLLKIQNTMKKIISQNLDFEKNTIAPSEAKKLFEDNKYKLELIDTALSSDNPILSIYKTGDFIDLCEGPHIANTREIEADSFCLNKVAGAYWRGDEKREMLTRIYGLAFNNKEELDQYIKKIEEAKKRDHRILGRELGLFIFSDLVGPGLPLWTPKGTFIRNKVNEFVQELRKKYNYGQVTIPHLTKNDLYKKSGHWEKYAEDLYKIETRDGHVLCMKPMNCPHHAQIYASEMRSYRDLPIRYSETTMVYRDEQSGELNGLSRVLSITQDDAHIFCREDQIEQEMNNVWDIIESFYKTFGFTDLVPRFSRRDDNTKFKGNIELWEKSETAIRQLLEKRSSGKWIDGLGEAAFYGPKVDFMAKDAIGRDHQVGTIQVDFLQPHNFKLEYVSSEGKRETPVMIHCAIAGSLERFMSVYIENTLGNFPLWISPIQIAIIPINNEAHKQYAEDLALDLSANNIRNTLWDYKDSLGKKIQKAKSEKIPYWIIIGDKDKDANLYTLESRDFGQIGQFDKDYIINKITKEDKNKS